MDLKVGLRHFVADLAVNQRWIGLSRKQLRQGETEAMISFRLVDDASVTD